jgi:hypothetical protein
MARSGRGPPGTRVHFVWLLALYIALYISDPFCFPTNNQPYPFLYYVVCTVQFDSSLRAYDDLIMTPAGELS